MELKTKLNQLYDKSYIVGVYNTLKIRAKQEKSQYYEPAFDNYSQMNKEEMFLNCWRAYFKELMPHFNKHNRKKNIETIHLIFGNEISVLGNKLYSNALFFRVALRGLYSNIENYKN